MVQMRIRSHPVDLMVDTGTEHSNVTQPVGLLSQKHTTIIQLQGTRPTALLSIQTMQPWEP
jgi:hypothetical protein